MPVFSSKLIQTGKPLDLGGSNTLETYVSKLEPKPVNASKVQKSKSKYSSVQFSHSVVSDSLRPHESLQARPPCPSPTPGVYPNSCPSSW